MENVSPARTQIVKVEDRELNAAVALKLLSRCEPLVTAPNTVVIVDLGNVRFIDSLAVSCLVRLAKKLTDSSRLFLVGLSRYARTVANVTHLDEVVEICETTEQAVSRAAA
ncbi:MAG: STAS domain-containing protein [Myxococcales bacterium]|nr:STAS domain-containing protein [Myxococcales bacterium]